MSSERPRLLADELTESPCHEGKTCSTLPFRTHELTDPEQGSREAKCHKDMHCPVRQLLDSLFKPGNPLMYSPATLGSRYEQSKV